jgi:hypothetical protein
MGDRLSGSRVVDVEHRAVGACPGLDEVEHERPGEAREQREPVSQRHWPAAEIAELPVLRLEHGRLTDIAAFEQPSMFTAFGLPASV